LTTTSFDAGYLFAGADHYQWCVVAGNGTLETSSTCVRSRLAAPTLQSAHIVSPTEATLQWTAVPGETQYSILSRDAVAGGSFTRSFFPAPG
jgi:hypothetical protein